MDQCCPVCSTPAKVDQWGPLVRIECDRCGKYALPNSLYHDLSQFFQEVPVRAALMSHTLRRMQRESSSVLTIEPSTLETYWQQEALPTPNQQADELILWIGDNQPNGATSAQVRELALDAWIGAPLPVTPGNAMGLRWLIAALEPNAPIVQFFVHTFEHGSVRFQLTLSGWNRYAALRQVRSDSRTAFMAMKFDDDELNHVVKNCFRPAVARTGFELRVLTDHQQAGLIDDQIRAGLLAARFVVADLTHGSYGAYWEAGFADGRGLPVIYTCRRTEWEQAKTHFDTNHMTTILWDSANLKPSEDEMTAIIRATLRGEAKQFDE